MELRKPTAKEKDLAIRLTAFIDLELPDKHWVLIYSDGMIAPNRTEPAIVQALIECAQEAVNTPCEEF